MTDQIEAIRKALHEVTETFISGQPYANELKDFYEACNPAAIRSLLERLDSAERERNEAKSFARWFAHKVQTEGPSANLCAEALPIAMHVARKEGV